MANPRLSKKLEAAVVEKLAAGDSHIIAEAAAGDVPSDSPSLAASSESPDDDAAVAVEDNTASSPVGGAGDEPSLSSKDVVDEEGKDGGGGRGAVGVKSEGGVLLEPGVASVEELFKSDTFSKRPVSRAGSKEGTGSKPAAVKASEGGGSKEQLRA